LDNSLNTCVISLEEYARLIRCENFLKLILSHEIDKSYPSPAEEQIRRIQNLMEQEEKNGS